MDRLGISKRNKKTQETIKEESNHKKTQDYTKKQEQQKQ